jgi:hypothetical protein
LSNIGELQERHYLGERVQLSRWLLAFLLGCILFRGGIHKPIETIKTFILFLQKAAIFDCFRWNRNLFGLWRYLGVIAIQPFFALIFDVKTASQCL